MKRYLIGSIAIIIWLLAPPAMATAGEPSECISGEPGLQKRLVFGGDENYPPFLFRDDEGKPTGYHIDLIRAIAEALDYQIEIQLHKWDDVMRGLLKEKTIDITSLAYQKRREKNVLFSIPHLIESSEIYIRKNTRGIESLDDLRGREIVLMRNATTHMNLEDRAFDAKYIFVDSEPEALLLLSRGKHDAAIVGRHLALSIVQRRNLKNLITVGEPLFPRDYVLATALDRQALMDDINRGLKILKSGGRYDELNRKWFGTAREQKHLLDKIVYYAALIIAPLLILASLSIAWSRSLKRKVDARTSELQAELAERKRTEAALLESEAKFKRLSKEFKAILDGIPGILALFDEHMQIVWCNKSGSGRRKPGDASILESEGNRLIDSLILQDHHSAVQQCFQKGCEINFLNTDAYKRTWEVNGFPMKNALGQTTHLLVLANDVTENIQLREEAIAANRLASLGELSAGVAHEINNPTGLILLYLPFLQDFFKDTLHLLDHEYHISGDRVLGGLSYDRARTEIDKSLNGVMESAQRIKRSVEDLKNFARQDAIDMSEVVDINDCVRTAVRLTTGLIKKSTHRFKVKLDENDLRIRGNLQQIEQVIINLVQNACFALARKNDGIFVRSLLDRMNEKITVEIKDEGCGMTPEVLQRITDPFYTTRRESGGTGIGLSISARIMDEHGGRLEFESRPGSGTLARVIFPMEVI